MGLIYLFFLLWHHTVWYTGKIIQRNWQLLLSGLCKLSKEIEKEGTELEGHGLWVVQWMCVTLKLRTGNHAKRGKVEEDGGREKVEWEKQQDMKDTPLSLPLLPWRRRQQTAHQQIPEDVCYLTTSFPHETLLTTKRWNISRTWCSKKAVIRNNQYLCYKQCNSIQTIR